MFAPAHLRAPQRDQAILVSALVVLSGAAWLALWAWQGSPNAGFLDHGGSAAPLPLSAALFTLGWLVMIIAMMLPSSVPLVVTFAALTGRRKHPGRLVALVLLGYLLVWAGFGLAAWTADLGVHAAVAALPWLAAHPRLILGATLLVAGLWQFSPLRERCLEECRSPLGFVLNRWRGRSERREAFGMGVAHGAFCVGCCWSIMLVMFGVGLASLTAMLVLGGLTAVEKNRTWGRKLTKPIGIVLVLAAVYAVAG
jgi:predicted metal-binding membrane protein